MKYLFILLISITASATPLDLKSLKIQSGINSDYVDGQDIRARVFGYGLNIEIRDDINEDTELFFASSVILETGSNEVIAGTAEFAPLEGVFLNEGGISYTPIKLLNFKAGALSGAEYNSPLLLTSAPFIGVQETIDFEYFYFKALQSIPSNNRLARRVGTLDAGTPSFYMETLGFRWKRYFQLEISHFQYRDLAPNIANQSVNFGNSISGTGNESSRFNYGFNGYNVASRINLALGSSVHSLYGQYLVNDEAPTGRNEGYLSGLKIDLSRVDIAIESFKNETDTSPAFYNSKYYGHNNSQGYALGMSKKSKSSEFQIKYYQLNPIEDNAIQFESEIIVFNYYLNYEL